MITTQSDLFDPPILPGLRYGTDVITSGEELALIESINAVGLAPFRFQGWVGKRLTASFGWRYDFDSGQFSPCESIPSWLMPLRAHAAKFAGLDPAELVQALLIR